MDVDGPIRFAHPAAIAGHDHDRADELRERDAVLAEEQAALRRVAAVVAGGAVSADVFAAVTQEVGKALGLPYVDMLRYEADGTATVIGAWGEREHPFEVGTPGPSTARRSPRACARPVRLRVSTITRRCRARSPTPCGRPGSARPRGRRSSSTPPCGASW